MRSTWTMTSKLRALASTLASTLGLASALGLVGSFAGDQVGKFINMDAVLRALEKRDVIELQKIMRSASTLGVIAVRTVSIPWPAASVTRSPASSTR